MSSTRTPCTPPVPADSTRPDPSAAAALAPWGWDAGWDATLARVGADASASTRHAVRAARPARVARVDRGACDVLSDRGSERATLTPAVSAAATADPTATPCVGDWVLVRPMDPGASPGSPDRDRLVVDAVLPRRTAFVRTSVTPGTSHGQVLAANVDVAVIVEPLLPEPDLGRVERFLALAWESGARPVVVLTKADLVRDAADQRADVAAAAPGVPVHAVSAVSSDGTEAVRAMLGPGITLALLGPSGAGKSTLTNALAGEDIMATAALRGDGKGRHTTAHRELVILPGGGLVVDTPGLRSVGLTAAEDGLGRVFADVEQYAASCRFADCAHGAEPGCAVVEAVATGELPARRLESWRKLGREAAWMARKHDARLRAQELSRWKRVSQDVRRSGRIRP